MINFRQSGEYLVASIKFKV